MLIKDIMNLVVLEIMLSIQEYLHKRKIKDKELRKEVNS